MTAVGREPPSMRQGLLFVVLALVFLGFAIFGTAGGNWLSDWIGVWVFFRATTGWRRYFTDGLFIAFNILAIGLFVLSPLIFEYDEDSLVPRMLVVLLVAMSWSLRKE